MPLLIRLHKSTKIFKHQKKNGFDVELGLCGAIHVGGRNSIINDNGNDLRPILIYLRIKGTNGIIYKWLWTEKLL